MFWPPSVLTLRFYMMYVNVQRAHEIRKVFTTISAQDFHQEILQTRKPLGAERTPSPQTLGWPRPPQSSSGPQHLSAANENPTKFAIDCEMVGTGPRGSIGQLARCSIVSYEGDVVYDKFIKPPARVTDPRTRWSGIRYRDLANATPYSHAREEILQLLAGKVVIGHDVRVDFKALGYNSHPAALTRDTARMPLLNRKAGFAQTQPASLKRLTKAIFDRDIQKGRKGHSSVEDAKATMDLYKVVEEDWERMLEAGAVAEQSISPHSNGANHGSGGRAPMIRGKRKRKRRRRRKRKQSRTSQQRTTPPNNRP